MFDVIFMGESSEMITRGEHPGLFSAADSGKENVM